MIYKFTDNLSEEEFEEELEEMHIIWKENSHLPYDVLIDHDGKNRKRKDNSPRIMISIDEHYRDIVPISIDRDNPEILLDKDREVFNIEIIKHWIIKNYDILIRHWNQRLDDYIVTKLLKKRSRKEML